MINLDSNLTVINPEKICFSESRIEQLENIIKNTEGSSLCNEKAELGLGCEYKHKFLDGIYVREMFIPKGLIIVSFIHKTLHPFFIMIGDVTVYSEEDGRIRIKAPYCGTTKPGTKRALYTHEDTIWTTVHATKETDIKKIGEAILTNSPDDPSLEEAKKVKALEV